MFSSFEIKSASRDHTEPEIQIRVDIAANLSDKARLAHSTQSLFKLSTKVEPALTIVRHEHSVHYAYLCQNLVGGKSEGAYVLMPVLERFGRPSTDSFGSVSFGLTVWKLIELRSRSR